MLFSSILIIVLWPGTFVELNVHNICLSRLCPTYKELLAKGRHSMLYMIQELIAARDGFKIIQNLYKNEIIEFIFYISTIDVI